MFTLNAQVVLAQSILNINENGNIISEDYQGKIIAFISNDNQQLSNNEDRTIINNEISSLNDNLAQPIGTIDDNTNSQQLSQIKSKLKKEYLDKWSKAIGSYPAKTQRSLENLARFAKINGKKYTVKVTPFQDVIISGETVVESNGNQLVKLTEGFEIIPSTGNELLVNQDRRNINSPLVIGGTEILTSSRTTLSIVEEGTTKVVRTIEGEISLNSLRSIKDAEIRLDKDDKITYADFRSVNGGSYIIDRYKFIVGRGGRVVYDPEGVSGERKISGEEVSLLEIDNGRANIESFNGFTVKLNENGGVDGVTVKNRGKYIDGTHTFSAKNGDLEILFNGEDISDLTNAVSINGDIVSIKGQVSVKANGNGVSYEGLSDDALTQFDRRTNYFDVKRGDAKINNEIQEVLIENGVAKLKRVKSNQKGTDFVFTHVNNNGERFEGHIDQGKYKLFSINDNKKILIGQRVLSDLVGSSLSGQQISVDLTKFL